MPLCGFNPKMTYGLSLFQEGLVEHGLLLRSKIREETLDVTLQRELGDMERFLEEMPDIRNPNFRKIVEGITVGAQGFYSILTPLEVENGTYMLRIKQVSDFLQEMDNEYYRNPESKPDDMKKLVLWINKTLDP